VITGFNTDIEFEGVTYHVQTEDKGLSSPIILSLVYDRGTILASKRLPYDDLLKGDFDEKQLAARLRKQHRLICAAVQTGRIEDLKQMTLRETAAAGVAADASGKKSKKSRSGKAKAIATSAAMESAENEFPIPMPFFDGEPAIARPSEPMVQAAGAFDGEFMFPAEAVEIISEMYGNERPANNKLSIEFLGDTKFKGGERKTVGFMVCRGSERKVVGQAQIMVKLLGSSFRPLIFHASTDDNGIAKVNLQVPNFNSGRAAFLVRAISDGEEIELRRNITHG
jgi:hypothetical protein